MSKNIHDHPLFERCTVLDAGLETHIGCLSAGPARSFYPDFSRLAGVAVAALSYSSTAPDAKIDEVL